MKTNLNLKLVRFFVFFVPKPQLGNEIALEVLSSETECTVICIYY
ncbi:hypothetical protein GMMP1_160051 [Candidatus Magnetomoraceae bacterium gMMP-1]